MSSIMQSLTLSGEDQNQNPPKLITEIEASNATQKQEVQTRNRNNNKIRPANHCSVMHSSCTTKVSLHSGQSCQNSIVNSGNIPDESKETKQVSKPSQVPTTGKRDKKGEKEKAWKKKRPDRYVYFKVNGKLYQKLGKIGSGGSSVVYKVISIDFTIYSLKKIKLKGRGYPTAFGFCQEIEFLNRLKGKSNIIQLIDYEVTDKSLMLPESSAKMKEGRITEDHYIYIVLEYGEIDLAHMISQKWRESNKSTMCINENWLRFYWKLVSEPLFNFRVCIKNRAKPDSPHLSRHRRIRPPELTEDCSAHLRPPPGAVPPAARGAAPPPGVLLRRQGLCSATRGSVLRVRRRQRTSPPPPLVWPPSRHQICLRF